MDLSLVESAVSARGLALRGVFLVAPEDDVPPAADGREGSSLVLVGNAGPGMFRRFSEERGCAGDLLDDWSTEVVTALADALGGWALYPFQRPHLPFIRWAQKADACRPSPIGILIHPEYGLWHGYRGAIAFAGRLDLPDRSDPPNPCDTCADRPCLDTCPVSAFGEGGYDVPACARHLSLPEGADCMALGCRARRACPVGAAYRYEPAQAHFHMAHFLRVRGPQAAG
jgi:hypothetical protein